jgi:type IV pilus assembly protein PilA
MRSQKGFSLIELLIVVAIILIIAAIAIPNFLKSKMAANEATAASTIRSIMTAQTQYKIDFGLYADTLDKLHAAKLIDGQIGLVHEKAGYKFVIPTADASQFQATGEPLDPGRSGTRSYCTDGGAIHVAGGSPTPGSAADCLANIAAGLGVLN